MEHTIDFWQLHGFFFVFFLCILPRITMLVATSVASVFGGPLFWVGWLLAPRLTVAIIGTSLYWDTNPVLCVFTWLWMVAGELSEKGTMASGSSL